MFNKFLDYHCRYCKESFRLKMTLWNHLIEEHKQDLKIDFGNSYGNYKNIMNPSWREK